MATTHEDIREVEQLDALWRAPAAPQPRPPVRRRVAAALDREIDAGWSVLVGTAWVVLFTLAVAIQPAPDNPDAAIPLLDALLSSAMLATIVATVAGLAGRRRWGLVAAAGGSVLFGALTLACPATGHHALAAWWFGQLACAGALGALSFAGLRRA